MKLIKQLQIQLKEDEVDLFKRELVKEMKTAYYNLLMAIEATDIYANALEAVNRDLKTSKLLLANGKGLPVYVSRAESEVKPVESQLQSSVNEQKNAKAYLNFLLNRNLSDSIIVAELELRLADLSSNTKVQDNVTSREELKSLETAKNINGNLLKMNKSFQRPRLNVFLDAGAQGYNLIVQRKSFFLAEVQMQVPLFTGKRYLYPT